MFSPLYLKIFEKSPFLMKTPTQNFAHHTEVKKHPFGVKTPILATLFARNLESKSNNNQAEATHRKVFFQVLSTSLLLH